MHSPFQTGSAQFTYLSDKKVSQKYGRELLFGTALTAASIAAASGMAEGCVVPTRQGALTHAIWSLRSNDQGQRGETRAALPHPRAFDPMPGHGAQ